MHRHLSCWKNRRYCDLHDRRALHDSKHNRGLRSLIGWLSRLRCETFETAVRSRPYAPHETQEAFDMLSPPYDLDNLPLDDDARGDLALLELLRILFGPVNERLRLRAANLILRYCAPLPIRRCHTTVEDVSNWLDGLSKPPAN